MEKAVKTNKVKEDAIELVFNKNNIKRFLDLISLSGENQITEALLHFNKDCVSTLVKSPTNSIGLSANLKGNFGEIGEIGIDDLSLLKNILNLQDKEEITLKIKANKLSIASIKTKASLLLRDSDFIKNKPKEEDFNKYVSSASGNEFSINEEDIERITKAYNLIKSENINIISDNGKDVKFIFNKLDNSIETEIDLEKEIQPFKVIVSSYFLNILNFLKEASISVNNGNPVVLLNHKEENIEINYIVQILGK